MLVDYAGVAKLRYLHGMAPHSASLIIFKYALCTGVWPVVFTLRPRQHACYMHRSMHTPAPASHGYR